MMRSRSTLKLLETVRRPDMSMSERPMRACEERLRGNPLPGGHVGPFVSSKSQGKLSQSIADWLVARE